MSGGSSRRQSAEYHKNSHPGGDVIPMHMCDEPSCREATGRDAAHPLAARNDSWCASPRGPGDLIVCTLIPGHAGDHVGADAQGEPIATWPAATVQRDMPDGQMPVSGRREPRETEDVTHDVRFWGNLHAQGDLFAECDACHWSAGLLGGHTGPQLMDLVRQHAGITS